MKKFLKKKEGFTLVELIVVIAILGILAAVAIPAYSGYITKANEAADYLLLDEILTATQFAVLDTNNTATLTGITVGTDPAAVTVTTTATTGTPPTSVDISAYVTSISYKSGATGATWTNANNGKWTLTK